LPEFDTEAAAKAATAAERQLSPEEIAELLAGGMPSDVWKGPPGPATGELDLVVAAKAAAAADGGPLLGGLDEVNSMLEAERRALKAVATTGQLPDVHFIDAGTGSPPAIRNVDPFAVLDRPIVPPSWKFEDDGLPEE
jgi:hypothetical protein